MVKHLKITGRVQGVGYRYFTLQNARERGVTGWVKNMRDGSVEALLAGPKEQVVELIEKLKAGPFSARVSAIEELETDQREEDFQDFKIR